MPSVPATGVPGELQEHPGPGAAPWLQCRSLKTPGVGLSHSFPGRLAKPVICGSPLAWPLVGGFALSAERRGSQGERGRPPARTQAGWVGPLQGPESLALSRGVRRTRTEPELYASRCWSLYLQGRQEQGDYPCSPIPSLVFFTCPGAHSCSSAVCRQGQLRASVATGAVGGQVAMWSLLPQAATSNCYQAALRGSINSGLKPKNQRWGDLASENKPVSPEGSSRGWPTSPSPGHPQLP